MEMEGVDGLNTVGIWVHQPKIITAGESFTGLCCVLYPEAFYPTIKVGSVFKLWDGTFFAKGVVTELYLENLKNDFTEL